MKDNGQRALYNWGGIIQQYIYLAKDCWFDSNNKKNDTRSLTSVTFGRLNIYYKKQLKDNAPYIIGEVSYSNTIVWLNGKAFAYLAKDRWFDSNNKKMIPEV